VLDAPAKLPCARCSERMHTGLTGTARTSRLSPRNGFTAYTRSPRGTAFLAPVAEPTQAGRIDARVAAPGPRDFAVRCRRFVRHASMPDAASVHRSPSQRIVTIAKRPSSGLGMDDLYAEFSILKSRIFLQMRLDRHSDKQNLRFARRAGCATPPPRSSPEKLRARPFRATGEGISRLQRRRTCCTIRECAAGIPGPRLHGKPIPTPSYCDKL
jgi:hypothetical protein